MKVRTIWFLFKNTFKEWKEDEALRLGAALSYYTIFSLAPLLIIVIGIASVVFGSDAARERILGQLQTLMGSEGATAIQEILGSRENKPSHGLFATIVGAITLLVGATGVVGELQESLNKIWDLPKKKGGLKAMLTQRLLSFAMILGIGFLLLVSLVLSAALSGFASYFGSAILIQILNIIISLGLITVLFAAIFKFLPDVEIPWGTVWIGAFFTSLMFTIGKTLTGIYLAKSAVASSFGAAGSLVIILIWVYYNSQILFFGAEFTQVYSKYRVRLRETEEQEESNTEEESEALADAAEDTAIKELTQETDDRGESAQAPPGVYKLAYKAGYKKAQVEATQENVAHKWTLVKWGYRIADFVGFRRTAKLGLKGYRIKKKLEHLTGQDSDSEKGRPAH